MMKLTPDDPRLSSYLLGELTSEEAAAVELEAAADPAIRLSLRELERTVSFLGDVFSSGEERSLLPSQREAVLRAGRATEELGKVVELSSARRSWRPWVTTLGAAAAVAFAALLMSRIGPEGGSGAKGDPLAVSEEVALLPMPGPSARGGGSTHAASGGDPTPTMVHARRLEDRPGEFLQEVAKRLDKTVLPGAGMLPKTGDVASFSSASELRLPVLVGTSSFRWVSGWIREKGQLPPRDAVRTEELINVAALTREPVRQALRVTSEMMVSPWTSGAVLVAIQIEAGSEELRDLELIMSSSAKSRVLGSFAANRSGELPKVLPAKRRTLLMVEFRADELPDPVGSVSYRSAAGDGELALESSGRESSAGMRHAVLMAGFGMWLRNEEVSAELLSELLQGGAAGDDDPVRADARQLVLEAIKLAEAGR